MRSVRPLMIVSTVMMIAACRADAPTVWFDGSLQSALAAAAERDTVVMVEFYTDWCNWCQRLASDTFTDEEVRTELSGLVAIKVNADRDGAEMAARYGITSYPTLIFFDSSGNEMERILGYLPPDKFLRRVQRIRSGDTFLACLRTLEDDPGNVEAIERSVEGLLERSDPEGAISRIEAFQEATAGDQPEVSRRLMFAARAELLSRVYQRAGRLYRQGWDRGFEIPGTEGTENLKRIVDGGLADLPDDDQAELMRKARYQDAGVLLQIPELESLAPGELLDVADFAFANGHFDLAADLYLRWFDRAGATALPDRLNDVAWRLHLSGRETERAIAIARRSYATSSDPEAADTLARLLYAQGEVDEAIELEGRAAEAAEGSRSEAFRIVAERMRAGEEFDDSPTFESYPGTRRR